MTISSVTFNANELSFPEELRPLFFPKPISEATAAQQLELDRERRLNTKALTAADEARMTGYSQTMSYALTQLLTKGIKVLRAYEQNGKVALPSQEDINFIMVPRAHQREEENNQNKLEHGFEVREEHGKREIYYIQTLKHLSFVSQPLDGGDEDLKTHPLPGYIQGTWKLDDKGNFQPVNIRIFNDPQQILSGTLQAAFNPTQQTLAATLAATAAIGPRVTKKIRRPSDPLLSETDINNALRSSLQQLHKLLQEPLLNKYTGIKEMKSVLAQLDLEPQAALRLLQDIATSRKKGLVNFFAIPNREKAVNTFYKELIVMNEPQELTKIVSTFESAILKKTADSTSNNEHQLKHHH
jgi:hypothetical protein